MRLYQENPPGTWSLVDSVAWAAEPFDWQAELGLGEGTYKATEVGNAFTYSGESEPSPTVEFDP